MEPPAPGANTRIIGDRETRGLGPFNGIPVSRTARSPQQMKPCGFPAALALAGDDQSESKFSGRKFRILQFQFTFRLQPVLFGGAFGKTFLLP